MANFTWRRQGVPAHSPRVVPARVTFRTRRNFYGRIKNEQEHDVMHARPSCSFFPTHTHAHVRVHTKPIWTPITNPTVELHTNTNKQYPRLTPRTSGKTLRGKELCTMINSLIRTDRPAAIAHAALFARCLNMRGMTRGANVYRKTRFPVEGKCWRGTSMGDGCAEFFTVGKKCVGLVWAG